MKYQGNNKFKSLVEIFPQDKGWHFVRVPKKISEPYEILADRGLIAVVVTIGNSFWNTSLLPYGDNTHFIALPKKNTSERKDIFRGYYGS